MAKEFNARQTTKIILVHFSGDSAVTFSQLNEQSRRQGILETGYHFIIERDGKLLMGRHQSKVGAHYPEYDGVSVGILVAAKREDIDEAQSIVLTLLLDKLRADYPFLESIKYIYRTQN